MGSARGPECGAALSEVRLAAPEAITARPRPAERPRPRPRGRLCSENPGQVGRGCQGPGRACRTSASCFQRFWTVHSGDLFMEWETHKEPRAPLRSCGQSGAGRLADWQGERGPGRTPWGGSLGEEGFGEGRPGGVAETTQDPLLSSTEPMWVGSLRTGFPQAHLWSYTCSLWWPHPPQSLPPQGPCCWVSLSCSGRERDWHGVAGS